MDSIGVDYLLPLFAALPLIGYLSHPNPRWISPLPSSPCNRNTGYSKDKSMIWVDNRRH